MTAGHRDQTKIGITLHFASLNCYLLKHREDTEGVDTMNWKYDLSRLRQSFITFTNTHIDNPKIFIWALFTTLT